MSLYAAGRTTGLVLDSGDGVTWSFPVIEGCIIPYAAEKIEISGHALTRYMQKLLLE